MFNSDGALYFERFPFSKHLNSSGFNLSQTDCLKVLLYNIRKLMVCYLKSIKPIIIKIITM